jgi:hypothetical protein
VWFRRDGSSDWNVIDVVSGSDAQVNIRRPAGPVATPEVYEIKVRSYWGAQCDERLYSNPSDSGYIELWGVYCDSQLILSLDIKPRSCPNSVNPKSKGKLPAAILGTPGFDVHDIDISTLLLEGIAPIRSDFEHVAAPLSNPDPCECTKAGPDGHVDLTLTFETQDIISALGTNASRETRTLTLTGFLLGGTPFEANDCIRIVGRFQNI